MIEHLIYDIQTDLQEHGFDLKLSNTYQVKADGIPCSGYFDNATKVVAVATKKPDKDWIPTLIHEYCHFVQYREKPKVQRDYQDICDKYHFFNWLKSKTKWNKKAMKLMEESVVYTAKLELDCEKRTVKMLKKYNLEHIVSIEEYTQKAIAYVIFYHAGLQERSWYKRKKEPYSLKKAWSKMPKTFKGLDIKDKKLVKIIKEACL